MTFLIPVLTVLSFVAPHLILVGCIVNTVRRFNSLKMISLAGAVILVGATWSGIIEGMFIAIEPGDFYTRNSYLAVFQMGATSLGLSLFGVGYLLTSFVNEDRNSAL